MIEYKIPDADLGFINDVTKLVRFHFNQEPEIEINVNEDDKVIEVEYTIPEPVVSEIIFNIEHRDSGC